MTILLTLSCAAGALCLLAAPGAGRVTTAGVYGTVADWTGEAIPVNILGA